MKNKKRCPWLNINNKLYVEYHDQEWGRPVHDDNFHFELLCLEGAQAGLSWEIVLNKREHYRRLFGDFDPKKISKMTQKKIEKLLLDPGIIRNRLKLNSMVLNAKAFMKIQEEFGSFDKFIWSFVNNKPILNTFTHGKEYPSTTDISDIISKEFKKRGFKFVGSTIIYAYMQAAGLTNDHATNCFLHGINFRRYKRGK